jgi:hypothetical protein
MVSFRSASTPQPQRLAHQGKGHGVQHMLELDVVVPVGRAMMMRSGTPEFDIK